MKQVLPMLLLFGACGPGLNPGPREDASSRILQTALGENQGWEKLHWLCDRIGPRPSGSENLARAIAWACETMRRDGLSNVRAEKVMVPVWVRGEEGAEILTPTAHPISMLGLGGSVGTPPGGITADVAVVRSFDELGDHVRGKIVVYNVPFTTYGQTVQYRVRGASEAAKHGAVAALVRSVTPFSLRSPHTGMMRYEDGVTKIPAAAISVEDAELLQRLQDRGETPRVRLSMNAKTLPDAESANVIGEIPGETRDIVLLGAHLDSWDVGTGAQDDGAGCVIMMEAARIIAGLGLRPRRTIRVVLFTNEENGLRGAHAYRTAHRHENHFAALEADSGADTPLGFGLTHPDRARQPRALAQLRPIARRLQPIGADRINDGGGGADIAPLLQDGVPNLGLVQDMSRYWHIHHTHADTLDKVDPRKLAYNIAAMAVMAWELANLPGPLGE